jgi:hypothetical protein
VPFSVVKKHTGEERPRVVIGGRANDLVQPLNEIEGGDRSDRDPSPGGSFG